MDATSPTTASVMIGKRFVRKRSRSVVAAPSNSNGGSNTSRMVVRELDVDGESENRHHESREQKCDGVRKPADFGDEDADARGDDEHREQVDEFGGDTSLSNHTPGYGRVTIKRKGYQHARIPR